MPTTKVRPKTPMKNRPALWRRMATKIHADGGVVRTGRKLKAAMSGTNHPGFLLPIHIWMFRAAGISTPVFDKQFGKHYTINSTTENESDIESQGEVNASSV